MKFQIVNVSYHNFKTVKQNGNVVMAKCTCCQRPRIAVYTLTETKRIFHFAGYDEQIAELHFSYLIRRQNSQSQD